MSLNETTFEITANTSAGEVVLQGHGEGEISIGGTFDTCSVAYHSWSEKFGRGPSIRVAATSADVFVTKARAVEIVVTSVGGSTDLDILRRPVDLE